MKLANLRRLKKAIDSYLEKEIHITHDKFDQIELANIARKATDDDMIKLMEIIVFTILNCGQKELFINPIMMLDEKCQTNLMVFIKNVLGECPDENEEVIVTNKELSKLREEKHKLALKINQMHKELSFLEDQQSKIVNERDELKVLNEGLESELTKRSASLCLSSDFINMDRDYNREKLRTENLTTIKEEISDVKKVYENEISRLKDELDLANCNIDKLAHADITLQDYKKKVEKMNHLTKKYQDLLKQNEILEKRNNSLLNELKEANKVKQNLQYLKDQLNHEKDKNESLNFAAENKEKQIKHLNKEIIDLSEKLKFAESKLQDFELERKFDASSVLSDESFYVQSRFLESEDIERGFSRHNSRKFTFPASLAQEQLDFINKEKTSLAEKYEQVKAKLKRYRESLLMQKEEFDQQKYINFNYIQRLLKRIDTLSDQMQVLSESVSNSQGLKIKHEQLVYEYDQIKNNKDVLMHEIKKLHEEKDLMYKRYIECREETIDLHNTISQAEIKIRELVLCDNLSKDKVKEYKDKEKIFSENIELLKIQKQAENQDCSIRLFDLEKEIITLRSETTSLNLRLTDKNERIQEILKDKAETIKILEAQHKDVLNKVKNENDWKFEQMIKQTEEALSELQNEREQLIAKLKFEKDSTLAERKKMNIMRDQSGLIEDVALLKSRLDDKENELKNAHKMNRELKKC